MYTFKLSTRWKNIWQPLLNSFTTWAYIQSTCSSTYRIEVYLQWRTIIWLMMFHFYAPPTIVEGHYVFWSVRSSLRLFVCPSVRLSVLLQVKVFGQGSFWWSWSPIHLKLSTHVPHDMIFLILMPNYSFDPNFMVNWT